MRENIVIILILQIRKLSHREVSLGQVVEPGFTAKASGSYNHALPPLVKRLHEREKQLVNVAFLFLNIYPSHIEDKGSSEISLQHQKTKLISS